MAEEQKPIEEEQPQAQAQAEPAADTTDWKAEARKWEARAKENKAKADKYDEAQEAAKSDLQKAVERAERAEAESRALKEEQERARAVKAAAAAWGVDEDTLSRMGGDVEANAEFLKEKQSKTPAYPQVRDRGEVPVPKITKEEIRSIKNRAERRKAIAENLDKF